MAPSYMVSDWPRKDIVSAGDCGSVNSALTSCCMKLPLQFSCIIQKRITTFSFITCDFFIVQQKYEEIYQWLWLFFAWRAYHHTLQADLDIQHFQNIFALFPSQLSLCYTRTGISSYICGLLSKNMLQLFACCAFDEANLSSKRSSRAFFARRESRHQRAMAIKTMGLRGVVSSIFSILECGKVQ